MTKRGFASLLLMLTLLPSGAYGDPGTIPGSTTAGVKVTRGVPFARETLDEVRALSPYRQSRVPGIRAIPRPRIPRPSAADFFGASSTASFAPAGPSLVSSISPSAPALDAGFAGLGNPPHVQGDVIPPDTMGAAGPGHLVTLMNSDFGVFDKATGAVLQQVDLQSFWASLGTAPGDPADFPFDTKVLYDTHSGRFIAMTLGGKATAPDSWVMVAVTATSDPTGTWYKWAIDADLDNNVQQFLNWADYPLLGVDEFNVYLAPNMFSNSDVYQYSKVWVVPKAQLLAGSGTITWFEFRNPPGSSFNMQPAHTFGTASREYFLYEGSSGQLLKAWMDNLAGTPVWHFPAIVSGVAPFASSDFLPGAPQYGDSRGIDTSDSRILNVVYRNGSLWATHNVAVNGKVEVAWYRINPDFNTVVAQGRISDPSRWFYYPSIAVNRDNVAAIGFSGSSAREYVGAYYTIVRPGTGTAEPATLLKSGEAAYFKTLSGRYNRWGDYSATVVDPSDNVTFWTLQEYAKTPDPTSGASRWGTWWGKFHPSDVAAPSGLTATIDNAAQITLSWTDQSANESGFQVERRRLPGQGYEVVTTVGPNVTSFTDNASYGLLAGFNYYYRLKAYDASGGSYSAEAFATTVPAPPPSSSGDGGGCLNASGSPPMGNPLTGAFSIGLLLLPGGSVLLRKLYLRRRGTRFRHPAC